MIETLLLSQGFILQTREIPLHLVYDFDEVFVTSRA